MTIAERIRLYRQQKNISQQELANLSGVNVKSLSRYELGTSVPPADSLKAIANALKISADALLTDEQVTIKDQELMEKFEIIQNMNGEAKKMVMTFLDMVVRDFQARQVYS